MGAVVLMYSYERYPNEWQRRVQVVTGDRGHPRIGSLSTARRVVLQPIRSKPCKVDKCYDQGISLSRDST